MAFGLAGVPHVIEAIVFHDDGAIDVGFPSSFRARAEHDDGFIPTNAVGAFDECNTLARPPGEIHAIEFAVLENGYVEAGAQGSAENGTAGIFLPAGRRRRKG